MFVQLYWGNAYGIQFRVHCQKHNYPFLFDKFRLITKKKKQIILNWKLCVARVKLKISCEVETHFGEQMLKFHRITIIADEVNFLRTVFTVWNHEAVCSKS